MRRYCEVRAATFAVWGGNKKGLIQGEADAEGGDAGKAMELSLVIDDGDSDEEE